MFNPAKSFKTIDLLCFLILFKPMIHITRVANKIHMLLPPNGALTQEQHRSNNTVYKGLEKELVGQNIAGKTRNKFNIKLN